MQVGEIYLKPSNVVSFYNYLFGNSLCQYIVAQGMCEFKDCKLKYI